MGTRDDNPSLSETLTNMHHCDSIADELSAMYSEVYC